MTTHDILGLFDKLPSAEQTGISETDRNACEAIEKDYLDTRRYLNDLKTRSETLKPENTFTTYYSYEKKFVEEINELTEKFIHNVFRHFRETYNVKDLNEEPFIGQKFGKYGVKYRETPLEILPVQDILKEVVRQLGGQSFDMKARQEVIDTFGRSLYYRSAHLKNKTVELQGWIYLETAFDGRNRFPYSRQEQCVNLAAILSLFEYNDPTPQATFSLQIPGCRNTIDTYVTAGAVYQFAAEKVEGVRFYKNGKTNIIFPSAQYAEEFYTTYCKPYAGRRD